MGAQSVPLKAAAKSGLRESVIPLVGVLPPLLVSGLDKGIASATIPRAAAELNGFSRYSLTGTAELLTSTIAMLVFAKLSDLYGRKPLYSLSTLILIFGSLFCNLAGRFPVPIAGIDQLILARGLVGIGDGAIIALAITLVADLFPPSERGRFQGVLMAVYGIGAVVGLKAGGWTADHFSWRWAFLADVPAGIIALLALRLMLRESPPDVQRRSIDWAGIATLGAWLIPLILALTRTGAGSWSTPAVRELLIVSAVMLSIFLFIEKRAAEPLILFGLFRTNRIALGFVNLFLQGICVLSVSIFLPVLLQGGRRASAAGSALVFTYWTAASFTGNVAAGLLLSRTGKYRLIATTGAGIAAAGLFLLSRIDVDTTSFGVLRDAVICGLGLGSLTTTYEVLVQNATNKRQMGVVTGSTRFFYSMGGTIGPALLGAILLKGYHQYLDPRIPSATPAALRKLLDDPLKLFLTRPNLDSTVSQIQGGKLLLTSALNNAQSSLLSAVHTVFLIGALIMATSCILNLLLVERSEAER